jgi:hypothetical protein
VPVPGRPSIAGSHLRLATEPSPRRRGEGRILLFLRALLAASVLTWVTLVAWGATAIALAPLLWRRAPLGRRLRPPRAEARVIPFQPGRRAMTR